MSLFYEKFLQRNFNFFRGNVNEDLAFEYDDTTETSYGCAATLHNEFWYFGGETHKQQVMIWIFETITFFISRQAKSSDVNSNAKPK